MGWPGWAILGVNVACPIVTSSRSRRVYKLQPVVRLVVSCSADLGFPGFGGVEVPGESESELVGLLSQAPLESFRVCLHVTQYCQHVAW